ncbi:MAG: RimK family protein [Bacteroidetes bacterium]|nr:RimK family protein [Bacteroidota bacterium]MBU1578395.1 RimK family protein [Bacteroidota bacterium]MBU2466944.1 RimK family protein [Bacteroidota bacterium]MBU2556597.1 RimK family protein [Bacteroidota bacterium]
MRSTILILDSLDQWKPYYDTESILTAGEYLQNQELNKNHFFVINLCNRLNYHSEGYYCSLLAQARGHKVLPDIEVINRLDSGAVMRLDNQMQKIAYKWMQQSALKDNENSVLDIFFGTTDEPAMEKVARYIFEQNPCPMLRVQFAFREKNQIEVIRPLSLDELTDSQQDSFAQALDAFSKKVWRQPRVKKPARYDLAILHDPNEVMPPSNKTALNLFLSQAKKLQINAELITAQDAYRLMEYDALFIRQTTSLNHITYRMAQLAQQADMVVIDDPLSIIRCTNKVYLKELLDKEEIPTPKSALIFKSYPLSWEQITQLLGSPIVLKVPDGSFSHGMGKATNTDDYQKILELLFANTAIVLAQEFLPTDFDWRIGVLNGNPLFACKYFMARGHWQIYHHDVSGKSESGSFETVPINKVPRHVLRNALDAANSIGKGLYGVDVKAFDEKSVIIEVNDNPSLDHGVEDAILGDELYRLILREFIDRLERKHR